MQKDVVSVQAREMIRDLRADLEEIARKDISLQEAVERLTRWDGNCSENSVEAVLSHVFHQRLMVNLLAPDLGPELFLAYTEIFNQSLVPMDQILREPQSPWFVSCPRQVLVERSLREAREELIQRLGNNMEE